MSKKTENQHIQVFARCRPLEQSETYKEKVVDVQQDKKVVVNHKGSLKTFIFDKAFPSNAKQIDVYKAVVEPLIDEVLMGFNCTVFAYGQTGTGKTYTMEGARTEGTECTWENDPAAGIIPRSMHQIFDVLSKGENMEFSVKVSYLELYNEEIYDLLSANDAKVDKNKIRLYDSASKNGSVIIQGLEESMVSNKDEVYAILQRGTARRKTAATQCNINSSRSHAVFSVTVHMKENTIDGEDLLKIGKLNLVDLAGSESVKTSGAIDKRLREAGSINQSLLTLGRVITALIEKTPHIPYRESKLTRLLQDSLGGHTKTSIIATISPSSSCIEETLNTLDYATKAKSITIRPQVNQKMTKKALIREYCEEIERLKKELVAARKGEGFYVDKENYIKMGEDLVSRENGIKELTEKLDDYKELVLKVEEQLSNMTLKHQKTAEELMSTEATLTNTQMTLSKTMTERDENKYVAISHEIKNKKLYEQATTLNSALDHASTDNSKLHSKLDRIRTVEMTNEQKIQVFREDFKQRTDESVNKVNKMQNNQQCLYKTTKENLDILGKGFERYDELSKTSIEETGNTKTHIHALRTDVNNMTESRLHWINDMIENMKEEKESFLTEQNIFIDETLPALLKEHKLKEIEYHDWYQNRNEEQKQKLLDLKDSEASQQTKKSELHKEISTVYDDTDHNISSLHGKIEKLEDVLVFCAERKAAQNSEIDQIQSQFEEAMEQVVKQMSAKLTNLKQQNDSQFSKMEQKLKSEILENVNIIAKVESGRKQEKKLLNSLKEEEDNSVQNLEELDRLASTCIPEEALSKQQEILLSLDTLVKSNIDRLKEIEITSTETSDKHIDNLEHRDTSESEDLRNIESQITKIKQSLESLEGAEKLQNAEISSLRKIRAGLEATNSKAAKESSSSAQQLNEALVDSYSAVEKFLSQDLVKDQPTGATPQRTSYTRPESLATLTPADRIRHRFHMQQDVLPPALLPLDSSFDESDEFKNSKEDLNFLTVPHTDGSESTGCESDSNVSETSEASVEVKNKENRPKSAKKTSKLPKKNKLRKPAPTQLSQPLGSRNTLH